MSYLASAALQGAVYQALREDEAAIEAALAVGAEKARAIARPVVAEMARRGTPFSGVLYVGLALTEIVMDPDPYDVLAVALSPFQLHGVRTAHAQSAAVLDVGVSRVDGKLAGDVAPEVWDVAGSVSPNPGGVGPLTRAFLVRNIVERAEKLA